MAEVDINQLQLLQQNLQQLAMQKQQFQKQLGEIDSALKEIKDASQTYQIIGQVMVATEKKEMEKELQEKKETLNLRLKSFEEQEKTLKKKFEEYQEKVMSNLKKEKK